MPKKSAVATKEREAEGSAGSAAGSEEAAEAGGVEPFSGTDGRIIRRLLAIDPGDVHVGLAEFVETEDDWECLRAYELTPDEAADRVAELLLGKRLDLLIIEEWRLYPDKALAQSYSELETVQLIGVLRYLHRIQGKAIDRQVAAGEIGLSTRSGNGPVRCTLERQPAGIKEATKGILRAHQIDSEARKHGAGPHALDAELHGYHWILKNTGMA